LLRFLLDFLRRYPFEEKYQLSSLSMPHACIGASASANSACLEANDWFIIQRLFYS